MGDPVGDYCREVGAGRVVAGRWVRLACARHLADLEGGAARGIRWDPAAAQRAIGFFSWLCLSEGRHAGKPFTLQPWQQFIVGSLFGWKGPDGYRRFRTAYVEIGKGNGKSPLAAGIGLYGLVADGEAGAEVYSAATTRAQASILFKDAKNMVEASKPLAARLKVDLYNLAHLPTKSFFRPLSSEHRALSGPRVHMALIDELHEHPSDLVVDKMRAGTKGRDQALILEITNSGFDRSSVCWQHHQYSLDVLQGRLQNDSWFAFVCGLDPCPEHEAEGKLQPADGCEACDDWRDPKVWPKANPNLGVSVSEKYLKEQVEEALGLPAKQSLTKRLNFCLWTDAESSWLSADLWTKGSGKVDFDALAGERCYGGLDLASKVDVGAWVRVYPDQPEPGHYTLRCRFWIPEATAQERSQRDGVPWLLWAEEGHVELTAGDVIDQDAIEEAIKADAEEGRIEDAAFDAWNATQLVTHLQQYGVKMVEFRQSLRNYTDPTKEFEALLKQGRLHHGDNPVLTWMAGNVSVITDRSGNVRPVKPEAGSPKKVDGIIAGVMALARAIAAPADTDGGTEFWE